MSKAWRWPPCQPIAAWIASCSAPSVIAPGTRSRRQIGGFVSRSVTFRLTTLLAVAALGLTVLAMIPACCRDDRAALSLLCPLSGKRIKGRPAGGTRPGWGGWSGGWEGFGLGGA